MKHPIQPLEEDEHGTLRFKANEIVRHLLDKGGLNMNYLVCQNFSQEDRIQFAQLIGYSLGGFGELSYVTEDAFNVAYYMNEHGMSETDAKILHYESLLETIRGQVKDMVAELPQNHPDDLQE